MRLVKGFNFAWETRPKSLQGDQKTKFLLGHPTKIKVTHVIILQTNPIRITFQFQQPQKFMMTDQTQLNHYQILFMRQKNKHKKLSEFTTGQLTNNLIGIPLSLYSLLFRLKLSQVTSLLIYINFELITLQSFY